MADTIGIKRLEAIHYYVHDLERSRRFYTQLLDFEEIAACGADLEQRGRQRSAVFRAGVGEAPDRLPLDAEEGAWAGGVEARRPPFDSAPARSSRALRSG